MSEGKTQTLRGALSRMVDGMSIDALLFTSFTFEPEFFESNVLPIVTDVEHVATIRELHAISEQADQLGVVVFHDGRARGRKVKRATYPTESIFIEGGGVFHPKVVVASGVSRRTGEEVTRLLVTSANLSFGGWGHQREAVASCTVDQTAVSDPLLQLLEWLAEHSSHDVSKERIDRVADRLRRIEVSRDTGVRLHVGLPGTGESLSAELIDSKGELIIAAPYFSPGFSGWLEEVAGQRTVTIIPAVRDDRVDLLDSELEMLWSRSNAAFERIESDAPERFDHLKMLFTDGRLYLGSHNATIAALGTADGTPGQNVEASLSFNCERFPYKRVALEPKPRGKSQADKDDDRERLLSEICTWVTVTVRWADGRYVVRVGEPVSDYTIKLPGHEKVLFEDAEYGIHDAAAVARSLQGRRVFQVWCGEELIHEGFVNEAEWIDVRPLGEFASLRDCFDAWRKKELRQHGMGRVQLLGEDDDADVDEMLQLEVSRVVTRDLLETYFSFFRATRGLRESLEAAAEDTDRSDVRLLQLIERAPGSLREAYKHIDEEAAEAPDHDKVFWFVVVHELSKLSQQACELATQSSDVRERAEMLGYDFRKLADQMRGMEWYQTVSKDDRERLGFILTALGYGDLDEAF